MAAMKEMKEKQRVWWRQRNVKPEKLKPDSVQYK